MMELIKEVCTNIFVVLLYLGGFLAMILAILMLIRKILEEIRDWFYLL